MKFGAIRIVRQSCKNNLTTLSVFGLFDGLKEGTAFLVDELLFRITYRGGDGNDVMLTRIA